MSSSGNLPYADKMLRLASRLKRLERVRSFDQEGWSEADTLAHAFVDLEGSFRAMLDKLLPRLLDESLGDQEIEDTLYDIAEELRHILYHIKDPKFFSYIAD